MSTTAPVPAAEAFASPPPLPAGTPPPDAPAVPDAVPAAAAPVPVDQPQRDRLGTVWDPAIHETPARLNKERCWAKLRGNAARRAAGLPPSGVAAAFRPIPAASAPEAPKPQPAADPPPTASQPPPAGMLGGEPPVVDGVPAPEGAPPARSLEDYAATAAGAVDGTFSAAQLVLGPAWELKPDERRGLIAATQRVCHHYQLPMVGPLLQLALVLLPVIGRRREDPQTRRVIGDVLAWFKRRGQPAPQADPYRAPVQPGSATVPPPPPPPDVPAAYRDPAPAAPADPMLAYK